MSLDSVKLALRKNIAYVAIAMFVIIVVIYAYSHQAAAAAVQPVPLPSQGGVVAPVVTPKPIVSPVVTPAVNPIPAQYCTGGAYCNGVPVPQSAAGIGAKVCGSKNITYTCTNVNGKPTWVAGAACAAGMLNMCPVTAQPVAAPVVAAPAAGTYCTGGVYYDGTVVPATEAKIGAVVCGTDKAKYTCTNVNGKPVWVRGVACTTGMPHGPK